MLDSHIHQEGINQNHTFSNWDLNLKQDYENLEPYVALLYPTEVYMEGSARGGAPSPFKLWVSYSPKEHI